MTGESPDLGGIVDLAACPECAGHGWVVGFDVEPGCCGNALPSGECCAAIYGMDRTVPVEVQTQEACATCQGTGRQLARTNP